MSAPWQHIPWIEEVKGHTWFRAYSTTWSAEVTFTAWLANGGPDGTHSNIDKFSGRGAFLKARAAADKMAVAAIAKANTANS